MTERPRRRSFLSTCLGVFAGCLLLWAAGQLLAQVWGWLLVGGVVAAIVWLVLGIVRWRRNRW